MNLPKINISRSSFSPRFFVYSLFGLMILILLAEGGYYFWVRQKEQKIISSTPKPFFTVDGVVEGVNKDNLIIKAENGSTKKVVLPPYAVIIRVDENNEVVAKSIDIDGVDPTQIIERGDRVTVSLRSTPIFGSTLTATMLTIK